jgi:hypothetical protein
MSAVDVDGGGVMDMVEFFVFLKSIGRDAENKLKDLLGMLCILCVMCVYV